MLFIVLFLTVAASAHGASGPGNVGFCAWNPLLFLNKDFCWVSQESQAASAGTGRRLQPAAASPGTSNQTGWDGPRHCVREYCVYSNRHFSGGIVVITNSENARRISELPDTTGASSGTGPPPFYAAEIPGKGTGLVANRTIRRGEPIMVWQPTFMVHRRLADDLSPEEHRRILDAALLRLPAARRRAFHRQLGQFGGHRASDILLTNSFQMDVGEGKGEGEGEGEEGHHLGNFPDVSRFNHDCRPNVAFRIDEGLAHRTHAVREIPAGEELTLSYMNPLEAHAARQQHILRSWGFACACPHCALPGEGVRESDARLREIDELEAELGDFASRRASVEMVGRLLDLYEKERLDAKISGAYVLAALNYNLFGDAKNSKKYAQLAAETGMVEFGPNADDVKAMEALAMNPKNHFTWKRRTSS